MAINIPFLYTIYSRGGVFTVINNYIYGPTLIVVYALLFTEIKQLLSFLIITAISYLLFALQYEVGYLTNDLLSVKSESNPTIRINTEYSFSVLLKAVGFRFLLIIIIYGGILISNFYTNFFLGIFTWLLMGVGLVYLLHNFLHLISKKLRIFTFSLLKISFWFLPSLCLFLLLSNKIQIMFGVTFLGALIFYVYSYISIKDFHKNTITKHLPKDLEPRLIIFITSAYIVYYIVYGIDGPTLFFMSYVYSYLFCFWMLRIMLRFIKN